MSNENHSTVKRMRAIADARVENEEDGIDAGWLRRLARDCGARRVKLLSGEVRMLVEDTLTQEEKKRGYILACQALAQSDVVVES